MTRRDWWLGIVLIVAALLVHTAVPRYEWRHLGGAGFVRIDRWTGLGQRGFMEGDGWEPAAVRK